MSIKISILLCCTLALTAPATALAQDSENRNDYLFKYKATPSAVPSNDVVVYPYSDNKVYTLSGAELAKFGDTISDVRISPASINYVILANNKKNNSVGVFGTDEFNQTLYRLNNKKYGNPTAIAYTPDARRILVATDKGLNIFDSRNFELLGQMELPYIVTAMTVSPNNNFLAITDGKKVNVYNFEEQRLRKNWNFDETVASMGFSKDSNSFAILTDDGLLSIYNTVSFLITKTIDDLGSGIDSEFNYDGKYIAVANEPNQITIINLLNTDDKTLIPVEKAQVSDIAFILDSRNHTLLVYNTQEAVGAKRLTNLEPYYGKLISQEVNALMDEWLKMMPGETMEEYRARVSDENRARQMRLFESEVSTKYADDLLSMSTISLGNYDRANNLLEMTFSNMPTIYLPVPEKEVSAFADPSKLSFSDTKYGIMDNDNFELIYAKIHNSENGLDYIYDNLDRRPLSFIGTEDFVSLEILQQQQMEELRLQELRERVMAEAKKENIISDHTNITVDSKIIPDYNADGERILNYQVRFSYEVEPGFSAQEDFAPGKYEVKESGAASSMLSIVKQAFEGDLAQYLKPGKKIKVNVYGNADGSPIIRTIPYNGVYGDFENELVYKNNLLTGINVNKKDGIKENEQLAFLRAYGVTDFLDKNVEALKDMNTDYQYYIEVLQEKGGEFRRITAEFTLIDVF